MRQMSFQLTMEQVRNRTKTVTRRLGWAFLKPGDLLQPVVKCQGLKKAEKVETIGGPIRVRAVSRETIGGGLTRLDLHREGFPELTVEEFLAMFCAHNGCSRNDLITRIEFEYVEDRRESLGR